MWKKSPEILQSRGWFWAKYRDWRDSGTEDWDDFCKACKVYLNIGLARASRGTNVFIAMKGTSDMLVWGSHTPRQSSLAILKRRDTSVLRDRIFLRKNTDHMIDLKNNNQKAYKKRFGGESILGIPETWIQQIVGNSAKDKLNKPATTYFDKKSSKTHSWGEEWGPCQAGAAAQE